MRTTANWLVLVVALLPQSVSAQSNPALPGIKGAEVGVTVKKQKEGGKDNEKVCEFKSMQEPRTFPSGATEIGFKIELDTSSLYMVSRWGYQLTKGGESLSMEFSTCDDYEIINGRPVKNRVTGVFTPGQGKAFEPGQYEFRVLVDLKSVGKLAPLIIPLEVK